MSQELELNPQNKRPAPVALPSKIEEEGPVITPALPEKIESINYSKKLEEAKKYCKFSEEIKTHVDKLSATLKENNNVSNEKVKHLVHVVYSSISQAKGAIVVTPEFFKTCLALDPSETAKNKLLLMFARNKQIPVGKGYETLITSVIEEVSQDTLYFLISQRKDLKLPGIDLPDTYEELKEQFLDDKSDITSKQVAIFVLAHREDIELPENVLEDLSQMRNQVIQERRTLLLQGVENDPANQLTPEQNEKRVDRQMIVQGDIFAFESVVLAMLEQRKIPGAAEFIRQNYGLGNPLRALALDGFRNSKELLQDYSVAKIVSDRAYPGNLSLDPANENFVIRNAPKGDAIIENQNQYLLWQRECFRGNDSRLANLLAKKIATLPECKLKEEELLLISHPLINYLSELRNFNVGKWDQLAKTQPELIEKASLNIAEKIWEERKSLISGENAKKTVFGKDQKLISIVAPDFDVESVTDFAKKFQMNTGKDHELIVQGSYDSDNIEIVREKFKKNVLNIEDSQNQRVILFRGHGGPERFWLGQGHTGTNVNDLIDSSFNLSAKELAEFRMANLDRSDIEFYDACFQNETLEKIVANQNKIALEQGLSIKSFPLTITASQRGMPSFAQGHFPYKSLFLSELPSRQISPNSAFTRADLFKFDQQAQEISAKQINTMSGNLQKLLDGVNWSNEFAIFGTRAVSNKELFQEAIDILGAEEYLENKKENIYNPEYVRPIQVSQITSYSNFVS